MVIGGPHPWKWHHVLILSCKAGDTPSGFTHRRERTAEDSNYVVDWNLNLSKKNLESQCLYLTLSWTALPLIIRWVAAHKDRCCTASYIIFTQLQTIRITLWLCAVTPRRYSDFKWRQKALCIPDIFSAFYIYQWQTTTSSARIPLQHTPLRCLE